MSSNPARPTIGCHASQTSHLRRGSRGSNGELQGDVSRATSLPGMCSRASVHPASHSRMRSITSQGKALAASRPCSRTKLQVRLGAVSIAGVVHSTTHEEITKQRRTPSTTGAARGDPVRGRRRTVAPREEALHLIAVDYEGLEFVLDRGRSEAGAGIWPEGNLCLNTRNEARRECERGDLDAGFRVADHFLRVSLHHGFHHNAHMNRVRRRRVESDQLPCHADAGSSTAAPTRRIWSTPTRRSRRTASTWLATSATRSKPGLRLIAVMLRRKRRAGELGCRARKLIGFTEGADRSYTVRCQE